MDDGWPDFTQHRNFMLARLRTAHLRARLYMLEIEEIGIALKANMITPETAVAWLADVNASVFLGHADEPSPQDATAGPDGGHRQIASGDSGRRASDRNGGTDWDGEDGDSR
jgi:hypothetical protein